MRRVALRLMRSNNTLKLKQYIVRYAFTLIWMSTAVPNTQVGTTVALGLYLLWVLMTYLLEGRVLTFQRPEDIGARLIYALVTNIVIGIGGSALVIRFLSRAGAISVQQAGFRDIGHAVLAVVIGGILGFALYVLQGAPTFNPIVIINAYAQVFVGSIAKVLVCWAVAGSGAESLLRRARQMGIGDPRGGHRQRPVRCLPLRPQPPLQHCWTGGVLRVIGLVTSAFFFISGDVYGTIVFRISWGSSA